MSEKLDYKLKLGIDSSELEKGHKDAVSKMVKVQETLTKLYKTELTILKKGTAERQSQLSVMQQQLRLQQKINSLQGKPVKPTTTPRQQTRRPPPKAPVNPDSQISYQARAGLQERVMAAANRQYNVVDEGVVRRIKEAQYRLRQLNNEIGSTKSYRALARMRIEYANIQRDIAGAVRDQHALNRAMQKGNVVAGKLKGSVKAMALSLVSAYAAIGASREVFRVGKEFDSMQAGLLAASDSAEAAKDNFTFLMDTAKRLGTDVESGVRGFNRLGVSMRGAGFSADEIKTVFTAAQEATATFQLSADKSNLVMLAMSQMASKGDNLRLAA